MAASCMCSRFNLSIASAVLRELDAIALSASCASVSLVRTLSTRLMVSAGIIESASVKTTSLTLSDQFEGARLMPLLPVIGPPIAAVLLSEADGKTRHVDHGGKARHSMYIKSACYRGFYRGGSFKMPGDITPISRGCHK